MKLRDGGGKSILSQFAVLNGSGISAGEQASIAINMLLTTSVSLKEILAHIVDSHPNRLTTLTQ